MKISIEKLNSINKLDFEIPKRGVYFITGQNGCGKSTLLKCIARIGDSSFFNQEFIPKKGYESFNDTKITYDSKAGSITYKHYSNKNGRWDRTKKSNLNLQKISGFSKVFILKVDHQRNVPNDYDSKKGLTTKLNDNLIKNISYILGHEKYKNLSKLGIKGRRSMFVCDTFSEKSFSSGELSIIRLLDNLDLLPNNALVLIDEAELSLHPLVQLRMLKFLETYSSDRLSTILISTHSPTLIKSCKKNNLFFLENNSDGNKLIFPCYPAYALQMIAPSFEIVDDIVFLVEDEEAKALLQILIEKYLKMNEKASFARYLIIPIGGWMQLLSFYNNSSESVFGCASSKIRIYFDNDFIKIIKDINKKSDKTIGEVNIMKKVYNAKGHIRFLPITPEIGVIKFIERDASAQKHCQTDLKSKYCFSEICDIDEYKNATNDSDGYKKKWDILTNKISCSATIFSQEEIKKKLYDYWANNALNKSDIGSLLGRDF